MSLRKKKAKRKQTNTENSVHTVNNIGQTTKNCTKTPTPLHYPPPHSHPLAPSFVS